MWNSKSSIVALFKTFVILISLFQSKEKLAQDPDSEIVTSSLRVSLACPVSTQKTHNVSK